MDRNMNFIYSMVFYLSLSLFDLVKDSPLDLSNKILRIFFYGALFCTNGNRVIFDERSIPRRFSNFIRSSFTNNWRFNGRSRTLEVHHTGSTYTIICSRDLLGGQSLIVLLLSHLLLLLLLLWIRFWAGFLTFSPILPLLLWCMWEFFILFSILFNCCNRFLWILCKKLKKLLVICHSIYTDIE